MVPPQKIVGHTLQREQLLQDLESNNVAHAYLFSGPRHLGKMTIARWFAKQLLSADCDEEEAKVLCTQADRLMHPDLFVLDQLWMEGVCDDWDIIAKTSNVPQAHRAKKPAAKTDVISIDDIRALQERLVETGTGTWRCCIIRSMERMQDAAANAFLKILEEPPPSLVFLLTTQSEASLLPTIVSRARVLRFRRLPRKDLLPLMDGVPEDDAQFVLHLSGGAPGVACTLRDDHEALRTHRQIHTAAASFWRAGGLRERLHILSPLYERGEESERLLLHLALTLRENAQHSPCHAAALQELADGLRTNAHRQLLAQRFALAVKS